MHHDMMPGPGRALMLRQAKTFGLMLAPAAAAAAVAVCGFLIIPDTIIPAMDLTAIRKTCDRVVEVLLTSRDLVELQRSDILIRRLDCSVSLRLPKEP